MEIITYVSAGRDHHKDSMGHGPSEAGDMQMMSAGTGIRHSRIQPRNRSSSICSDLDHPGRKGRRAVLGMRPFPKTDRAGHFVTLASGLPGDTDALPIRTSARVLGATLNAGQQTEYRLAAGRHAYLVPAAGKVEVNGVTAAMGDGLAIEDERVLHITASEDSELVLVDTV